MQIHPIRNDADYQRALKEIEPYFDHPPADDDPVWDSVDVMAALIEQYEKRNFPPLDHATAVDAIRFCMDQRGLSPEDLVSCIGRRKRVDEVLAGKRPLTLPMIRKLHEIFGIPLDYLVRA